MKNFVKVFLTVLVMLMGTRCFALKANNHYPELVCDATGTMHYTIVAGDTLSEIAQHYRKTQTAIAAANDITDTHWIYSGKAMMIPCSAQQPVAKTDTNVTSNVTPKIATNDEVLGTLPTTIAFEQTPAELSLTSAPFVATPDNTTVAAVTPQPEHVPLTPSRSRSSTTQAKKVKGYQLILASEVAKRNGLPLNRDLPTRVFIFPNEEEKEKGLGKGVFDAELHNLRSRAKQIGTNVVLDVSLEQMPNRPFIILIAGVNQPIDGDFFMASCEPLRGRFPGPRPFTRVLFTVGRMSVNTLLITVMTGGNLPLGLTGGVGLPLVHAALQHHLDTIQRRAEAELQLAEREAALPVVVVPTGIPPTNELALATSSK